MTFRRSALVLILLAGWIAAPAPARAAAGLELYGTFEAMGAIVDLAAGDDPDQDATAGKARV